MPEQRAGEDELSEVGSVIYNPTFRPTARKRQRTSTERVTMHSAPRSPTVAPSPNTQLQVRIKSEAEIQALGDLQLKAPDQRVKIYVGNTNAMCEVGLEDLDKSPVLKSLISNVGTDGAFIMHPELTKISADHFQSVREFLLTDEYTQALMDNPLGQEVLPKRLDGCTTAEHYRHEALRNGHLYVVAKFLSMRTLLDLIYRKITLAQFQPYGIECLLNLALTVFSRPDESRLIGIFNPAGLDMNQECKDDVLEEWIVQSLGDRLQPMMINHARLFFEVANHGACAARNLGERVLRRKVEFWNEAGSDVIAIEDDD
jgi:hypothetical protein